MSTKNTPTEREVLMATDDQVGHIKGLSDKTLRALSRDQAQIIIQNGGIYNRAYDEMLRGVSVKLANSFTVIAKRVDYSRDPYEVIRATGHKEYLDDGIVSTMPRLREGIFKNVPVTFFNLGEGIYADQAECECNARDLVYDPYAQAAVNEAYPLFVDKFPNGTQWGCDERIHSCLMFYCELNNERMVYCNRNNNCWGDSYWLCGVPNSWVPES